MAVERKEEIPPNRTFINIILNRASLGNAEHVYAVIKSVPNEPNVPAFVPRKDIKIIEQPLKGSNLLARLYVDIIGEEGNYHLVETTTESNRKVRMKIDKESKKILPISYQRIFFEEESSS